MSNFRQLLFDAVKAGFATITTANGYTSNVGQKVNEWQVKPIAYADSPNLLPCTCLSDPNKRNLGPGQNVDENSSSRLFGQDFEAALVLAESNSTPANARQAEADVMKMIGKNPTWGIQGVKRTEPEDSQLKMSADGTRVSEVLMKFTVKYVRKTWE
jgi:hypothetical protein